MDSLGEGGLPAVHDFPAILAAILDGYVLPVHGDHGIVHWARGTAASSCSSRRVGCTPTGTRPATERCGRAGTRIGWTWGGSAGWASCTRPRTATSTASSPSRPSAPARTPTPRPATAFGLAFSPDGTRLAVAREDNAIRLWDVATRQEVAQVWGHTAYGHPVAFSPDGEKLVSASGDFTLRVWDAAPRADGAR